MSMGINYNCPYSQHGIGAAFCEVIQVFPAFLITVQAL
jgi:hypothetical protein